MHRPSNCPYDIDTCEACHNDYVQLIPAQGMVGWFIRQNDEPEPGSNLCLVRPTNDMYCLKVILWALERNGSVVPLFADTQLGETDSLISTETAGWGDAFVTLSAETDPPPHQEFIEGHCLDINERRERKHQQHLKALKK